MVLDILDARTGERLQTIDNLEMKPSLGELIVIANADPAKDRLYRVLQITHIISNETASKILTGNPVKRATVVIQIIVEQIQMPGGMSSAMSS